MTLPGAPEHRFNAAANYTIDNQATVAPWLSQVAEANIQQTITQLQGYQNR